MLRLLTFIISISWPPHHLVHPHKVALPGVAGHVTEVLAKVVIAGGTGLAYQAFGQLKILLHVLQLTETAAEVWH